MTKSNVEWEQADLHSKTTKITRTTIFSPQLVLTGNFLHHFGSYIQLVRVQENEKKSKDEIQESIREKKDSQLQKCSQKTYVK